VDGYPGDGRKRSGIGNSAGGKRCEGKQIGSGNTTRKGLRKANDVRRNDVRKETAEAGKQHEAGNGMKQETA
jgi:hypothetical protein